MAGIWFILQNNRHIMALIFFNIFSRFIHFTTSLSKFLGSIYLTKYTFLPLKIKLFAISFSKQKTLIRLSDEGFFLLFFNN